MRGWEAKHDGSVKTVIREATDAIQEQLGAMHGVLIEGNRLDPPKSKWLHTREPGADERYNTARSGFLGV